MKRPPDAEPVSQEEYDRIRKIGTECVKIIGVMRGGYYHAKWFYTTDGLGPYRVPCPGVVGKEYHLTSR